MEQTTQTAQPWWKRAVVYEIYLRSFQDSDGDGHGDLNGITARIPYLKELGVDALWITPFFDSPLHDMGYDIRDYERILDTFGTMEDFETLLGTAHAAGIRIILDMVLNHTSDEHAWFIESRKDRTSAKRDWYVWHPGRDGAPPNNWQAAFGGPAWSLDERTGEYYLHQFAPEQPDLNWRNPEVRKAMFDMVRFWLDKGIDGLRLDVINSLIEDEQLRDNVWRETGEPIDYDTVEGEPSLMTETVIDRTRNQPETYEIVETFNREVLRPAGEIFTVGESWPCTPEVANGLAGRDRLDVCFHFDFLALARRDAGAFKDIVSCWNESLSWRDPGSWNAWYLSNHDMRRQVSVFGEEGFWHESATLLAAFLLTQQGTVFLYQGEEIGMTDVRYASIGQYRDVMGINRYHALVAAGATESEALAQAAAMSRDNGRTPMQWDASRHAGFTTGQPWLGVNPNYERINVAAQTDDPDSVLSHYRRLIRLRRDHPALSTGRFSFLETRAADLLAYDREDDAERLRVLLNFGTDSLDAKALIPDGAERLYGNRTDGAAHRLDALEARVYRLA